MALRGIKEENLAQDMQDIAGLRVMVQFVDDVEEVLDVLRKRHDMRIVQERDYIKTVRLVDIEVIMSLLNTRLIPLMATKQFCRDSNPHFVHELLGNN